MTDRQTDNLVAVQGGQTDTVQLSPVRADDQRLLCRTHTHGRDLLADRHAQLVGAIVWRDLTRDIISHSGFAQSAVDVGAYPDLPALSVALVLGPLIQADEIGTRRAREAL